jgi:CRP-like cAMP-binding protein
VRTRRLRRNARGELLHRVPLFAACGGKEIQRIAGLTTEIHVEAGRVLTLVDEPGAEFFVIMSGTATVWRGEVQLDTLGPGSFFGELSLFDRDVRTATVVADTEMRLLVLSRKEFFSSNFLVPSVMERMLAEIGRRLRRADRGWATNEKSEAPGPETAASAV